MVRLLGPAPGRFKGNKSVWESGKVNLAITYRNEFGLEKQAIPRCGIDHPPLGDQVQMKDKKCCTLRMAICNT